MAFSLKDSGHLGIFPPALMAHIKKKKYILACTTWGGKKAS